MKLVLCFVVFSVGQQSVDNVTIATELKRRLAESLSRLQTKVQYRAQTLKQRGQSYRVDRLDAIQNNLIAMKAKLNEWDPNTEAGQSGLRSFSRNLAKTEGRIATRLGRIAPL